MKTESELRHELKTVIAACTAMETKIAREGNTPLRSKIINECATLMLLLRWILGDILYPSPSAMCISKE